MLPTQITEWKPPWLARAADVWDGSNQTAEMPDLEPLHAKIGHRALEHEG